MLLWLLSSVASSQDVTIITLWQHSYLLLSLVCPAFLPSAVLTQDRGFLQPSATWKGQHPCKMSTSVVPGVSCWSACLISGINLRLWNNKTKRMLAKWCNREIILHQRDDLHGPEYIMWTKRHYQPIESKVGYTNVAWSNYWLKGELGMRQWIDGVTFAVVSNLIMASEDCLLLTTRCHVEDTWHQRTPLPMYECCDLASFVNYLLWHI